MTNLDKILTRIAADAEERVRTIERETDEEIARLAGEDEALLKEETEALLRDAERDAGKILTLAKSSALALRKKRVLEAKSRALTECLAAAEEKLAALPEEEYAALVLTLVEKNADGAPGTVYLAQGRPVADRAAFAARLAALPGKKLSLAEETCGLATGVLVSYGKIDLDLSFGAVIAERRDAVRDRLNDLVFRDAVKE